VTRARTFLALVRLIVAPWRHWLLFPSPPAADKYPVSDNYLSSALSRVRGISCTNIGTEYDQLVLPSTRGIEQGRRNITVQDKCSTDYAEHFEIAADPVAAGHVLDGLDPAHPSLVPCKLVLPLEGPVA